MHPLINIAVRAARKGGDIIMQASDRLDRIRVSEKQAHDFVTNVDQEVEQVLIETIREKFPSHGILAEESGDSPGDDFTWIIDPLDGTSNFIHGFPHYAISIALRHKSVIEQAVIYDPIREELFTASRGDGAQLNNRRMRVSTNKNIDGAFLGTGFPFKNKAILDSYLNNFKILFSQAAGIRRAGSAALDLAYVAAGRLDGFWEYGLNIWDIAAGILLIKEAGGIVSDMQGSENYLDSGDIVAGNPHIFKQMVRVLK